MIFIFRAAPALRPRVFRIEWRLYELDTGELVRCPPKDDSYRSSTPQTGLSALVLNHTARTKPTPYRWAPARPEWHLRFHIYATTTPWR